MSYFVTIAILSLMLFGGRMSPPATEPLATSATEPFRQVLTSTSRGINLDDWRVTDRDFDFPGAARWSVHKYRLRGGRQEGVDIVVIDNGRLRLTVIPTRGMGILKVEMGSLRLGWDSPVKEVVHPQYINLHGRGGLGWLEGFNEWMARCGLEFAGHPGKDRFINNVGEEAEMDLTLHGKIANIPASEVEVVIDRDPPHRIRVRGRVDERMFYGPKLELWTEVSTVPGASAFQISDQITNRGADEQEFQIIYHANYGPPLLEEGSRFVGAIRQVTPFNAHAAKSVRTYDQYAGPTRGFIEQVYCLHPYGDAQGRTMIMLRNAAGTSGVTMSYALAELPYLTLWKNTTALEEGYVTGLEPGTGFPSNRRIERKAGRVPRLAPGASRSFTIDLVLLDEAKAVADAAERIRQLQAGRPVQIDAEPQRIE